MLREHPAEPQSRGRRGEESTETLTASVFTSLSDRSGKNLNTFFLAGGVQEGVER
jgi:hypothetical protein